MSNIKGIIPFTEMFERSQVLSRDNSDTSEDKFKGLVNDAYAQTLPRDNDWDFLIKESDVATSARYNTGTVDATAASTSITGNSTSWVSTQTSALGWKIKFTSNGLVYDFDYVSGTSATITPALSGDTDISSGGYVLFRDTYALPSDFDRFLLGEEGGLQVWRSGRYQPVPLVMYPQWRKEFRSEPSDFVRRCRLRDLDSSGNTRIQINPPTKKAIQLPFDYIKLLDLLVEYTTGNISVITNASPTVTLSGSDLDGNIITSSFTYYFRVDADGTGAASTWYLISSVTGNTTITLSSNYLGTSIASGTSNDTYTISRIPEVPSKFHDWIIYEATTKGIADQSDPNFVFFAAEAKKIFTRCKVLYKSRRLNKQFGAEDDVRNDSW